MKLGGAVLLKLGGAVLLKLGGAVTKVFPDRGQLNTLVTIDGTELYGNGNSEFTVTLSGVLANVQSSNKSSIIVKAGVSGLTTAGAVTVTADTGAVVTAGAVWQYVAVGVISSVTPDSGQLYTKVTLVGTDLFAGGTGLIGVTLAGKEIDELKNESSTKVVVSQMAQTKKSRVILC